MAAVLVIPLLSGCLSFLDDDGDDGRDVRPPSDVDDPSDVRVTGVQVHGGLTDPANALTIQSADGTALSAVVYEPLASEALPDGSEPTFPAVIFVHGFGFSKEMWLCPPMGEPGQPALPDDPCPFENLLQRFAEAGFIAIAYDTRGFGRSEAQVTVVGPAELADLDAVIDHIEDGPYAHNGKTGITGISYGGGHALMGLATNPRIDAAAAHQGWHDLYEALLPGNTPKAEWSALLVGEGTVGSAASLHPSIYGWLLDGVQRTNLDGVEADLDSRSPAGLLEAIDRPLLLCHGMQDTLFTQVDDLWDTHGGFTRTVIHDGGHGVLDPGCWDKTEDWFAFFLRGVDSHVDEWPVLETVDVAGGNSVRFEQPPITTGVQYHLREPQLTQYSPSNVTFTIEQTHPLSNPLSEPGGIWDQTDLPAQAIPHILRQDPSAVFFEAAPLRETAVLIGSASATLDVASAESQAFQVTAQLIHVLPDGDSRIIARGAYSHVPGVTAPHNGSVEIDFSFTKAELAPQSVLVLKLGPNDTSWFLPYPGPFTAQFTGQSTLTLPFYQG